MLNASKSSKYKMATQKGATIHNSRETGAIVIINIDMYTVVVFNFNRTQTYNL